MSDGPVQDAARLAFAEGLKRRAALHSGAARQLLDTRIAGLTAGDGEAPRQATPPQPSQRGPLGALADLINQRTPSHATPASQTGASAPAPDELKALGEIRNTWVRLEAEKRLRQAAAQAPENAGPLNSYQLVLRTLLLMRDVSPEYLQRFMAQVDTLMWLERGRFP